MGKLKILYLCTGNSCRSQMAEAWTRHLKNDEFEAYSAGIQPTRVNSMAKEVMKEAGVDISGYTSKDIDELDGLEFDYVITLCENAQAACPVFPAKRRLLHVPFDDPPELALKASSKDIAILHFRRVRDEIKAFVEALPGNLAQ